MSLISIPARTLAPGNRDFTVFVENDVYAMNAEEKISELESRIRALEEFITKDRGIPDDEAYLKSVAHTLLRDPNAYNEKARRPR